MRTVLVDMSSTCFKSLEMAAHYTRAVPCPPGFYRVLHNGSTADSEFNGHPKTLLVVNLSDQDVYVVERLSMRKG